MEKKLIALLLATLMCLSLFTGCGSNAPAPAPEADSEGAPASDVTLEIQVAWADESANKFQAIMDDFTAETGIKTDIIWTGRDQEQETQLKIKMASNDLPDVWWTHGWAVMRYKDFLMDLSNEPWVSDVSDAAMGVISDDDGVWALPVSISLSCIIYNQDVLDAAGVQWDSLLTWAKFEEACEKIKEAGYAPLIVGGKDSGNVGGLVNSLSLGIYGPEDSPEHHYLAQFIDGTVDVAEAFSPVLDKMVKWNELGYYNADILTLDTVGMQQGIGAGTAAFCSRQSNHMGAALTYYPDAPLSLIPYPAMEEGGKLSCAVGEGTCFGAWKDTKHPAEVKQLLEWMSRPENAARFLEFDGNTAGMKSTPDSSVCFQAYQKMLDAFGAENIYFDNMFDRQYLPSGMWNVISEGGCMLLDGTPKAEVGSYMDSNFHVLYEEAHSK